MSSFSAFQWVIVAAIVYVLYRLVADRRSQGDVVHCMTCGSEAKARVRTKGSFAIELVLWLCFIVPGLIYTIWRLTTRDHVCSVCGATNVVPPGTPAAITHREALAGAARQRP